MKILLVLFALLCTTLAFGESYPVVREPNPFPGSRFYVPNDRHSYTSVIMLHGSEGGSEAYIDSEANILATQGYAVLVFCYFDCGRGLTGPRQTLRDIEATQILDAVAWLRSQKRSNQKVVVYGFSRGAELTLVIGSLPQTVANRPNALIAHSPSDVFNGPWNWSWHEPSCWLCKAGIGHCSETSAHFDFQWNPACGPDDPNLIDRSQSAWLISGTKIPSNRRIEIEKFANPILVTVGEKDEVWSVEQTKRIEATLKNSDRPAEVHYFPNQGHVFQGGDETKRRELVLDFLQKAGQ